MSITLLMLALQLSAPLNSGSLRPALTTSDSVRDLEHARAAQVAFEHSRRALLPQGQPGGGHCDMRLGRFCWWYDGGMPHFPPENSTIGVRREELLADLDSLSARYPGDAWLVGMRVHYRLDARDYAHADSAARDCHAAAWWCAALVGYAAHVRGDSRTADSAYNVALADMPADSACEWKSIEPLLGDERGTYEHLSCSARAGVERRYWMLSRPRLDGTPNEWRNEFNTRRVIAWLGRRSATPHLIAWGRDAEELVLRYGWPVAWSKVETSSTGQTEPSIIGHDPSPSFPFAAKVAFADSLEPVDSKAWNLDEIRAEARYAPKSVRRVGSIGAQFARFRRGDSVLVVAAYAAHDDSVRVPSITLGAATYFDTVAVSPADTVMRGHIKVMMARQPVLVGVDVSDTASGTLLRTRYSYAPVIDSAAFSVSDMLIFRGSAEQVFSLDSALARAIPGDTATRNHPVGLFWETYGIADGASLDITVSVERLDHSWIRSARQKLRLTPVDTPIRMKWNEARPSTGRAVSLDLANLDGGRYRVTLTVTQPDGRSTSSTREVELTDP